MGLERTVTVDGAIRIAVATVALLGVAGRAMIRIFMFDLDVKRRAFGQAEDRLTGLQRLDFREQKVFRPVDVLNCLLESKLRPSNGLQLLFLPTVSA
jgi:hypothetical protein